MALNFNVLAQVPSVAERFMAGRQAAQEEQQRNMLLQQRAEQAQLERENALVTRQKTMADLEAARQRKAALSKVAEVFRRQGKALDLDTLNEGMSWALESGNADAIKQVEGLRNLFLQQQEDERIFGPQPGAAAPAAPAGAVAAPPVVAPVAAAAPAMEAAPVTAPMAAPAIDERGVNRAAWMAKAGLEEDVTPPAIPTPVNALAPTAAAPVNAMVAPEAAPGVQVAGPAALPAAAPKTFEYGGRTYTPQQIDMLLRSNRADRRDLGKAIVAANKPSREALSSLGKLLAEQAALPPGDPRRPAYDAAIEKESQRPEKGTPLAQYLRERDEIARANPADPRLPLYEDVIKRMREKPSTTVNVGVSTERKYGEQFAGEVAKSDQALWNAAQDAPAQAENANRILSTLATGKAITGPLADVKLNIARALNVVGVDNADTISKTEALVTSMAENTLNAIKTSGLGTGQGFTDKDLKFLQEAKSGNINFQPDTIRQLAELAHRAAEKTAEKWSRRVKQIPKSALEGTGVSTEPITVPKRASSVTAGTRPSGVGADWTLMQDANGKKAWVSPDRKQVKEVD